MKALSAIPIVSMLLLFAFDASPASAQRTEGSIAGTVTDPQDAAIRGAKVVATSRQTGQSVETTTDAIGFYRLTLLPPGSYVVTVEASGFKTAVADDIGVQVNTVTRADIALEIGSVQETVTVTGAERLLQTEEARLSDTIDSRQVTELPLNGREVYQLANLQPGVIATNAPVISNVPSLTSAATFDFAFVSNGATMRGNNFVLDGNTNNNEWLGGTPVIFPSVDAIQEVQVQTLNFSAEYGRNQGAVVNVVTKSGGNAVNGSAFYSHRNTALNARNFFDLLDKAPLQHQQFGAGVGGPIRENRTFYFVNYEGSRRKDGAPRLATAETPDFRDLVLRTRPDSLAARFLRDFPSPPCTGRVRDVGSIAAPALGPFAIGPRDGIADLCDTVASQVQKHRADQYLVRVDHTLTPQDKVFVRWIASHASPDVSRQQLLSANMRGFRAPLNGFFADFAADYSRVLTGNWVNNLRFAFAKNDSEIRYELPESSSRQVLQAAGQPNFFPHLAFDDGAIPFGGAVFIPRHFIFDTYTVADTITQLVGRHAMKYGFELRHIREDSNYELETRPFYEFNSMFNFANDQPWLADMLVNRNVSSPTFGQFTDTPRKFNWTQWAVFVQDDWKVRPALTLNVGVRYEVFGTPSEVEGRLNNIVLGPGADISEQLRTARVDRVDRMFAVDRNNVAPRLGVAWEVTPTTVVRGGFSVAYLEPYSNIYTNASRFNPPDATWLTIFPALGVGTAINYRFPVAPSPDARSAVTPSGAPAIARIAPNGVDPELDSAYSRQWFIGVQRQIRTQVAVSANYVGTSGRELYIREDWNRFTGDICSASRCDFVENRITPGWGQIFYTSNGSTSEYHGLNLQFRKNHGGGTMFVANYTLGELKDHVSDAGLGDFFNIGTPLYTGTMDIRERDLDYGPSEFDVRHRFTLTALWDLPGPSAGRGAAHHLLGGWQFNAIVALQSGRPWNVYCSGFWFQGCDFNMDGTRNDRPNRPSGMKTSGFSKQQFVDGVFRVTDFCPGGLTPITAGTPCVPPGTNGNLPRNVFRGPGYASVDLALFKNIPFADGNRLQFRAEVFNALNRANLFLPIGNMRSPNFGRSTSAFASRQFQLGLKLLF